ncbi:polyamine deacetylase HDAC10-like isoform X2 [Planococcus citri]|uniref:polyamine deacetylase HDAC10-like isoform X2 n=1 Tax=Planococcus citri TaxID=170843 RepID=UPI0031F9EE0D
MSSTETAITFNEEMTKHHCLWDPNYPECPERFSHVLKRCQELGLVSRCRRIPTREATNAEILTKHSPETITLLEECQSKDAEELEKISSKFDAVYICPETFRLAKMAAGSVIDLVKEVSEGKARNGMAIVRPPGHHAMKSAYCGYCFYNNVALAADYALKHCNVSKILIVDWDVHHGQATQQMFYDDNRVLYFSIHRFEYGTFWPNLRESDYDYVGEGAGLGYNFNVPLNKTGFGNSEYLAIFHELLLPAAIEFEPNLVLVSGGYDAALGDEKGMMKVEPACYAYLLNSLKALANGKVAVVLEGGYFLKSLAEGAALTLRALLGDPCPNINPLSEPNKPDDNLLETIRNVIHSHRPYWKCFQIYDTFSPSKLPLPSNCHNPTIKFEYDEEPLEVFPTRECYPIVTEDIKTYFNDWLDDLIESTILRSPKHKCALISDRNEYPVLLDYMIQNGKFVREDGSCDIELFFNAIKSKNVDWEIKEMPKIDVQEQKNNCFVSRSILKAIHLLQTEQTGSVLIESNNENTNPSELSSYIEILSKYYDESNIKKVFVIDLHYCEGQNYDVAGNILNFRISNNLLDYKKETNKIDLNWQKIKVENCDYLNVFFKTVLPVAYQFSPHLVAVFINFDDMTKNSITPELASFLIHWLSSFALGKVMVICRGTESESAKTAFLQLSRTLAGESLPKLTKFGDRYEGLEIIKELNDRIDEQWKCLNKFVKFPQ